MGAELVIDRTEEGYRFWSDERAQDHLWMNLKRIIGSHLASYREAWEGAYPLEQTGQAASDVHRNLHQGKVGLRALAPADGFGVRDPGITRPPPQCDQPFRGA